MITEIPMDKNLQPVGPLKKISLHVAAKTTSKANNTMAKAEFMEFIFGTGTKGLSPFECEIDGKAAEQEGFVKICLSELRNFFGHLAGCALKMAIDADPVYLHYKIDTVSDPSAREIVKAVAGNTGCGGDCDCGCG
jgi:hypothetical protein